MSVELMERIRINKEVMGLVGGEDGLNGGDVRGSTERVVEILKALKAVCEDLMYDDGGYGTDAVSKELWFAWGEFMGDVVERGEGLENKQATDMNWVSSEVMSQER